MLRKISPTCAALMILLAACNDAGDGVDQTAADTAQTADNSDTDYGYDTYGEDNLADSMASDDTRYLNTSDGNTQRDGETTAGADQTAERSSTPASQGNTGITETQDDPSAKRASSGSDTQRSAQSNESDDKNRTMMQLQVVLDREGFGPGVIDGAMGMSTRNALRGFQEANDLEITGQHDDATKKALAKWERIPATRVVTIPDRWADAEYTDMPEETAEKAELDRMGYKSLDERLAERFHTTVAVLKELNPGGEAAGTGSKDATLVTSGRTSNMSQANASATPSPTASPSGSSQASSAQSDSFFAPGQKIRVPNIGADRIAPGSVEDRGVQQLMASLGVGTEQPEVDRVVVSKEGQTLKAYSGEKLVALFTVTSGSSEFPLPLGEWDINSTAFNPPYRYDPEVLGNDDDKGDVFTLPPGPNSPVGVVWIDLSKEHYGIHGTPEPETIGRAQSSGCVRLTNWDAARLAQMVSQDTEVIFEA